MIMAKKIGFGLISIGILSFMLAGLSLWSMTFLSNVRDISPIDNGIFTSFAFVSYFTFIGITTFIM